MGDSIFFHNNDDLDNIRNALDVGDGIPAAIEYAGQKFPDPGDTGKFAAKQTGRVLLGLDVVLTYDHYKSKGVSTPEAVARTATQKILALGAGAVASETGPGALVAAAATDYTIEKTFDAQIHRVPNTWELR